MVQLTRTNSGNPDFVELVKHLDAELEIRDGDEHPFYDQFNKIHDIKYVVIAYNDQTPVSCGAIKEFSPGVMEVKRMFTLSAFRGKGIASKVLGELEYWAGELGFQKCILETGVKQPEAIRLYQKNNYTRIPNFGQYAGVDNSVCFEKSLA